MTKERHLKPHPNPDIQKDSFFKKHILSKFISLINIFKGKKDTVDQNTYSNEKGSYARYATNPKEKGFLKAYFSLPVVADFIELLNKKDSPKILDLGNGVGVESKGLEDEILQSDVFGVDISTEGSDESKHAREINQVQADVNLPPFAKKSFDGIHCKDVLIHIPDKDSFIKKISDIIIQDGLFLIVSSPDTYKNKKQFKWNRKKLIKIAKKYQLELVSDNQQTLDIEDWYKGDGNYEEDKRIFILFRKKAK